MAASKKTKKVADAAIPGSGYLPATDVSTLSYLFTQYESEACGMKGIDYRTAEAIEGEKRLEVSMPCLEDGIQMNQAERWMQSPAPFRERITRCYRTVSRMAATHQGRNRVSVLYRVFGPRAPVVRADLFDPVIATLIVDTQIVADKRKAMAEVLGAERVTVRGNRGHDFNAMVRRQADLEVTVQNALEAGLAPHVYQNDGESVSEYRSRREAFLSDREAFIAEGASQARALLVDACDAYLEAKEAA